MDNFKNRVIANSLEISNNIERVFFSELSKITNYYNIYCLATEEDIIFGFSCCVPFNYVEEMRYEDISGVIDTHYNYEVKKVKTHILEKLDPLRVAAFNIENIVKNTNYSISKICNFNEYKLKEFYNFCNISKHNDIVKLMNLGVCKKDIYKSLIFKLDNDRVFVNDTDFIDLTSCNNVDLLKFEELS